jgi:hypothetical protein
MTRPDAKLTKKYLGLLRVEINREKLFFFNTIAPTRTSY